MKKLLNKIVPNFILKLLIKQKYKKYNIQIHKSNIKNNMIVKIICKNKNKYLFLKKTLYDSFSGIIKIDNNKYYFHPIALINKPNKIEDYLKLIGAKSRNMIKKAEKNRIYTSIFNWNEKLEEIYKVNTSTLIRQGREMDDSYKNYPKEVKYEDIDNFKIVHIGAFKDTILVGYIELYIYGNFAMINRILGHKDYLKYGVMNILIKSCIQYMIDNNIEYLNYLTMQNRQNNSLSAFKYRVGFREYSLLELK